MVNPSQTMLTEAIGAARTGDRARARDLLARLLRSDSANAEYWIWMSAVVDTPRESIYCLESALKLDPTNRAALRGLVALGAREAAPSERPIRIPRKQATAAPKVASPRPSLKIRWRMVGTGVVALLGLLAIVGFALTYRFRPSTPILAPTLPPPTSTASPTPFIPTPTYTPIPAETRIFRTPVPSELAGTPISLLVEATLTATPIIGVTPRPSYEAYQSGLDALAQGRYQDAIDFMDQVIKLNSKLPDPYYFKGEALRLMGQPGQAVNAYDSAILVDADYAPAYLGRGRARLQLTTHGNPPSQASDLPPDFDTAIRKDPSLADAYIDQAKFFAALRLWKTMEEILQRALDNGLRAPQIYVLISQAQFNRQEYTQALESAITGSAADPTNLDGYLAIGKASVALDDPPGALWPLTTYTVLRPDDPEGWGYLSYAQEAAGDPNAAMASATRALDLNNRYSVGFIGRAQAKISLGLYQSALDDLLKARQYGSETFRLDISLGWAYFYLHQYVDAIKIANQAIAFTSDNQKKAQGYSLRAQVYEATNPPLLDEAKRNWGWILDTAGISDDQRAEAEYHMAVLNGETPPPSPTGTAVYPSPIPTTVTPIP